MQVHQRVDWLEIHSRGLIHKEVELLASDESTVLASSSAGDLQMEEASCSVFCVHPRGVELVPGRYGLRISFEGVTGTGKSEGLMRREVSDGHGGTVLATVTHLEPIACRTVFPCMDEPALKAVFSVRLTPSPFHHPPTPIHLVLQ